MSRGNKGAAIDVEGKPTVPRLFMKLRGQRRRGLRTEDARWIASVVMAIVFCSFFFWRY
jgi:hypothetical protein